MQKVQLNGFNNVDEAVVLRIKEIAEKQAARVDRQFGEFTVELHLKEMLKTSGKAKYNLDGHIKTPSKNYSSNVVEWDLIKGVHEVFDKVNKTMDSDVGKLNPKRKPATHE